DAAVGDHVVLWAHAVAHLDGALHLRPELHRPARIVVLAALEQYVRLPALAVHGVERQREHVVDAGGDGDLHEHLGLQRAAAVGHDGAPLHRARVLVDDVADVVDRALEAVVGTARQRDHDALPATHARHVRLVDVRHHPHHRHVGHDEQVHGRIGLAISDDLPGTDVALDDHAGAGRRHDDGRAAVRARGDGGQLTGGDSHRAQPRSRALSLSDRFAIVVLGLADVLLRYGLDLEQIARQLQGGVGTLDVGDRLRVIRLGCAEVRAVDHHELVAGFDRLAGTREHLDHTAGHRRVYAGKRLLVE